MRDVRAFPKSAIYCRLLQDNDPAIQVQVYRAAFQAVNKTRGSFLTDVQQREERDLRQGQQVVLELRWRLLHPALHKVDQHVRGDRPLQLAVDVVPGLPGTCTYTQGVCP